MWQIPHISKIIYFIWLTVRRKDCTALSDKFLAFQRGVSYFLQCAGKNASSFRWKVKLFFYSVQDGMYCTLWDKFLLFQFLKNNFWQWTGRNALHSVWQIPHFYGSQPSWKELVKASPPRGWKIVRVSQWKLIFHSRIY